MKGRRDVFDVWSDGETFVSLPIFAARTLVPRTVSHSGKGDGARAVHGLGWSPDHILPSRATLRILGVGADVIGWLSALSLCKRSRPSCTSKKVSLSNHTY